MKKIKIYILVFVVMSVVILGGCGTSQLLRLGRISAHRNIAAEDGAEIDVWVIKSRVDESDTGGKGATVVVLHPLFADKHWFLSLGERLAKDGWDVVLVDLRAHGKSGGEFTTWGALEKYDIISVMDSLISENMVSGQVYVLGASLGGCVAIQYAAADPRCRGVLAIAPPTGARAIAKIVTPLSTAGDRDLTLQRAGAQAGYDPDEASAVKAAGKLKCPIMLVHGRLDMIVPFRHSEEIYNAAASTKKLIPLPFADHTTVQVGLDWWYVKKMRELVKMAN